MAQLYLVRHAKAGERRTWDGDDDHRPLSKKGRRQSEMVGARLAKLGPTQLLSSRYTRCVQTLEPLGELVGLEVEVDDRLTEYEPIEPVLAMLADVKNGSVLCSHGDIIPAVIQQLKKSGTAIRTPTDWRKAGVWVLKRNKHGTIVHATAWPPPR